MLENETLLRALWTDLTCICRYKYDLTTFEQGKDVPLPNTKEKGIFDVSGCRTLQSHQTLASAITKWWDTHGERIGEEYDPCKVYTLFYDLSFVPKNLVNVQMIKMRIFKEILIVKLQRAFCAQILPKF